MRPRGWCWLDISTGEIINRHLTQRERWRKDADWHQIYIDKDGTTWTETYDSDESWTFSRNCGD